MAILGPHELPLITVKTWAEGDTPVVSLSGELDLTNAERVQSIIVDTLSSGMRSPNFSFDVGFFDREDKVVSSWRQVVACCAVGLTMKGHRVPCR